MPALSGDILQAWEKREGPVVLTTVNAAGEPNSIYATCVGLFEDKTCHCR